MLENILIISCKYVKRHWDARGLTEIYSYLNLLLFKSYWGERAIKRGEFKETVCVDWCLIYSFELSW